MFHEKVKKERGAVPEIGNRAPALVSVNFSRVFSLGFVMVGRSFLPVGMEKGQSISRLPHKIFGVVLLLEVKVNYHHFLLLPLM